LNFLSQQYLENTNNAAFHLPAFFSVLTLASSLILTIF